MRDMKRTFTSLVLGVALLMGGSGAGLAQDWDAFVDAEKRGDYATAFRELSLLASQGDLASQYNLGVAYYEGKGVTQDYREAVKWFQVSAAMGYAQAMHNLGWMYYMGRGVTQDYREALRLYRLASEKGFAASQSNLGGMYDMGKGITQDYIYAHMWFNIAASNGSADAAGNRDIVAGKMTAAQIARAQELAKQCVAKNYKGC
jgi:TPR repeat protein